MTDQNTNGTKAAEETVVTKTSKIKSFLRKCVPSLKTVNGVANAALVVILVLVAVYTVLGVATQHAPNNTAAAAFYVIKDRPLANWVATKTFKPAVEVRGPYKVAKCNGGVAVSWYGEWVTVKSARARVKGNSIVFAYLQK